MTNTEAGAALSHGDDVVVTLDGATYSGRVERRFIGPWPERREELFICLPGRFPYQLSELESYGAELAALKALGASTERDAGEE